MRRIKNVIVLMDWVPDYKALRPAPTPASRKVSKLWARRREVSFSARLN